MTDDEYVRERMMQDRKNFLTSALNHETAPRLAPTMNAMRNLLLDGEWHGWNEVLAVGLRASDLTVKTVDVQIRNAISCNVLERRGEYTRKTTKQEKSDTRQVRLVDWPK